MKCFACVLAVATVAIACQHELRDVGRFHGLEERLAKRQEPAAFPPVLNEAEATLVNSIDSTDLDTWSYYYTHGLHLAGTNEGKCSINVPQINCVAVLAECMLRQRNTLYDRRLILSLVSIHE
jgi:hypothetical protein